MRFLSFFLVFAFLLDQYCSLSCIGQSGKPVDWFITLKTAKAGNANNGMAYAYLDSNTYSSGFSFSATSSIGNLAAPPLATIAPLYKSSSTIGYAMYNDEMAGSAEEILRNSSSEINSKLDFIRTLDGGEYGHTKGVVGITSKGGFWLTHSVPKFPPSPSSTSSPSYPDTAVDYGQSFLCLTLQAQSFNALGALFQLNRPQIYSKKLLPAMSTFAPAMAAAFNNAFSKAPVVNFTTIETAGGAQWTIFGKTTQWNQDLYLNAVAPTFQTNLEVESWMRPFEGPISGGGYNVANVKKVCINPSVCWDEADDHSKWAVSTGSSANIVCISDINKATTQHKRGGGCACIENSSLHSTFSNLVKATD